MSIKRDYFLFQASKHRNHPQDYEV